MKAETAPALETSGAETAQRPQPEERRTAESLTKRLKHVLDPLIAAILDTTIAPESIASFAVNKTTVIITTVGGSAITLRRKDLKA